ncbi:MULTISPECIES: hypothetical protein [Spirulina sp. CCY15215]|uniref:hypothetical protein n=1 Tax=Spirulina sp. CCY15215 TaxID=2767591 RepID=UPI00194FC5D8|nr:hypothetical protein [Spirulina major]
MSSGTIKTAIDVLNLLVSHIDKTTLETELMNSGWIFAIAKGGTKSGTGKIWTSPDRQCSVRIMTKPDASSYARVYNGAGGGAPGEPALNALGQPGNRTETHFFLTV